MAAPKAAVRFTANFEANLASIAAFWRDQEAPGAYALLLEDLAQSVIGNLEQHPQLGRRFLGRKPQSLEVRDRVASLQQRLGKMNVREYLVGDYLILYAVGGEVRGARRAATVYLLAIRHHRQLSFDFDGFWHAGRPDPE